MSAQVAAAGGSKVRRLGHPRAKPKFVPCCMTIGETTMAGDDFAISPFDYDPGEFEDELSRIK